MILICFSFPSIIVNRLGESLVNLHCEPRASSWPLFTSNDFGNGCAMCLLRVQQSRSMHWCLDPSSEQIICGAQWRPGIALTASR